MQFCVSFLQQGTPELPPLFRVYENELSIDGRKQVIHHYVGPLAKPPKPEVKNASVEVCVTVFLLFVVWNNLQSKCLISFYWCKDETVRELELLDL